jgi:hypothetical protein
MKCPNYILLYYKSFLAPKLTKIPLTLLDSNPSIGSGIDILFLFYSCLRAPAHRHGSWPRRPMTASIEQPVADPAAPITLWTSTISCSCTELEDFLQAMMGSWWTECFASCNYVWCSFLSQCCSSCLMQITSLVKKILCEVAWCKSLHLWRKYFVKLPDAITLLKFHMMIWSKHAITSNVAGIWILKLLKFWFKICWNLTSKDAEILI